MAKNYYSTLQLNRNCSDFDIIRAFKKLSLRFHPNKTKEDKLVASHLFHDVAEAYEVLSDPKKRSCYDQLGEFGLKNGGVDGKGGYRYMNNADEIFQNFFKSNEIIAKLMDTEEVEGSLFGSAMRGMDMKSKARPADLVVPVSCSLEELYSGCGKVVQFDRTVLCDDRRTLKQVSVSKEVFVRRGMVHGQKIRVQFEGNMDLDYEPSDLVFVIEEQRHPRFKRSGKDLIMRYKIKLADSIKALPIEVSTLDGRTLTVSFQEIINPDTTKTIPDEGMPVDDLIQVHEFGSLQISFNIIFPKYLSHEKKLRAIEILS